jgi:hypothetical protein
MRRAAVAKGKLARNTGRRLRAAGCLALLCALAACGSSATHHTASYNPSRYYPPPGPPSDPWGPYIKEASGRFGVPEQWIRRVMRQESGGQEDVISWAGAMGLMQVMPETYNDLRARYNLGDDPFDPHNNLLAGTAYLREMYDRYGSPGFLAAYNAGPARLDRYLNNGTPLPAETINYVASIAPQLGPGPQMSGPLAAYAGGGGTRFASRRTPGGCDPDAAYNPDQPCTPARAIAVAAVSPAPVAVATSDCDPDAAYDPTHPCRPVHIAPVQVAAAAPHSVPAPTPANCDLDAAYDPTRQCAPAPLMAAQAAVVAEPLPAPKPVAAPYAPPQRYAGSPLGPRRPMQESVAQPASYIPPPPPGTLQGPPQGGAWGIQVGAFANLSSAQAAAENARMAAPDLLRTAKIELPATTPFGNQVAFRARLVGLQTAAEASNACARLSSHGTSCITVPPNRTSF